MNTRVYELLSRVLPSRAARIVCVICYVVVVLSVIYFAVTVPEAEFRYREI